MTPGKFQMLSKKKKGGEKRLMTLKLWSLVSSQQENKEKE